jgi:hypothetical protein
MYSKKTTRTKDNGTAAVGGWWPCFNQGEPTRTALLVRVLVRIPYIYSFRLNLSLALSLSLKIVLHSFFLFFLSVFSSSSLKMCLLHPQLSPSPMTRSK